jgi:50S ribosomal protein L16 3-hydroxylase
VGPHTDSYDVFLIQVQGRRRWRYGRSKDRVLVEGAPLKLLRHFEPTEDQLLEPGDMLYLPPGWGHDGTAEGGDCMTCSVGFRAPSAAELARELLLRLADEVDDDDAERRRLYRDPRQSATAAPGAVPAPLLNFAHDALARRLADPQALPRVLGEILTEPKPRVWFESRGARAAGGVALDSGTRMAYDESHVFINGEALRAGGRDATAMRRLADARGLSAADCARLSPAAATLLDAWVASGWVHAA